MKLNNSVAFRSGTNELLGNILGMDRATGEVRVESVDDGIERRYPAAQVAACWLDDGWPAASKARAYIELLRASVEGGQP